MTETCVESAEESRSFAWALSCRLRPMSGTPSPYAPPASDTRAGAPGSASLRELPPASGPLAAFLSFLIPGLGQVYAAQYPRAIAWFSIHVVFVVFLALTTRLGARALMWSVLAVIALDTFGLRAGAMTDALRTVARRPAPRAPIWGVIVAGILMPILSLALTFGQRRYVVEAFKIPSGSMIPTLLVGDHLFVTKLRTAHRSDVIVFPFPEHPDQDFVKRVVGMPGEKLEFRNGHPFINGAEVPHCALGPYSYTEDESPIPAHKGTLEIEVLEGHPYFTFYDDATAGFGETLGPYVVQSGEVFVVGDNRNNAHDSRMWFGGRGGGVPIDTIVGVTAVVWMSVNDRGVNWSRMGHAVDDLSLPASASSLEPALERCLTKLGKSGSATAH